MQQGVIGNVASAEERRAAERLFHRDLPGGGYVAIELASAAPPTERRVRIIVERRSDRKRRDGHRAPVILDEPWNPERGLGDLYRIACDNVSIARGLLRLKRAD